MSDTQDDDALSWAGENDPSHVAGPAVAAAPRTEIVIDPGPKPAISSVLLVTYGVIAGAYLIYTLGWVVAIQRYNAASVASTEFLNAVMFALGEALAAASPTIWFCAALLLTRGRSSLIRLLWLLVGLAAVIPWPFVLGAWIR